MLYRIICSVVGRSRKKNDRTFLEFIDFYWNFFRIHVMSKLHFFFDILRVQVEQIEPEIFYRHVVNLGLIVFLDHCQQFRLNPDRMKRSLIYDDDETKTISK